jgi:hypothetical protein
MLHLASIIQTKSGLAAGGLGLLAQFGNPGFSSGPPAIFMFFFVVIFVVVIGTVIFRLVRGVSEWSDNNVQPVLTVPVRVVTKRTALSVYSNASAGNDQWRTNSSTSYFATFEFSSGDRKEFSLSASQYGLLAENDTGELTFQGTRFQGFNRTSAAPVSSQATPAAAQPPLANEDGFCPYCGLPVRGDFKYCPQCSKPLPEYTAKS